MEKINKLQKKFEDVLLYLKEFRLLKTKEEVDYLIKKILEIHRSQIKGKIKC